MKKVLYLSTVVLSVALLSSFTEESESVKPKTKCDATTTAACKVKYPDGTTVDATGKATTVTDY